MCLSENLEAGVARPTEQSDRLCAECGRKFLSGVAHIDRGAVIAMICITCAQKPGFNWLWLKHLTKRIQQANLKAWKAKQDA